MKPLKDADGAACTITRKHDVITDQRVSDDNQSSALNSSWYSNGSVECIIKGGQNQTQCGPMIASMSEPLLCLESQWNGRKMASHRHLRVTVCAAPAVALAVLQPHLRRVEHS